MSLYGYCMSLAECFSNSATRSNHKGAKGNHKAARTNRKATCSNHNTERTKNIALWNNVCKERLENGGGDANFLKEGSVWWGFIVECIEFLFSLWVRTLRLHYRRVCPEFTNIQ